MSKPEAMSGLQPSVAMERTSICFPQPGSDVVMQNGDPNFKRELSRLYDVSENNALEGLVRLKTRLAHLSADDFWSALTEGLSGILDAGMTFVMKRVLVDEHDAAVEMPPLGEPGACLMAAAMHYCDHDGSSHNLKGSRFHAYSCPCAYMRHEKVFVIPDHLGDFITNNPNRLPMRAEAYIAVPLFAEGKCVAHFGAIWSEQEAAQRTLSWAFIEALLHSLEDMVGKRLSDGANFVQPRAVSLDGRRIIPHDAVSVAQSLRPYAGSLSHELRTPMQGVVGMLDLMHATVQEAAETQMDPKLQKMFQNLIQNIEVVQDSSRRAVEAADNVVHAYDMDMRVPDGPPFLHLEESVDPLSPFSVATTDKRPEILVAGSNLPISRPNKRRRDEAFSRQNSSSTVYKLPKVDRTQSIPSLPSESGQGLARHLPDASNTLPPVDSVVDAPIIETTELATAAVQDPSRTIETGSRQTNLRDVLRYVITDGLKIGGRPDWAVWEETNLGQRVEVRSRGSDGTLSVKTIEWSVDPNVPDTMIVDEKDIGKLVSCVFLNAVKFTDRTQGRVEIHAKMSSRGRYVAIRIGDNGPGIPSAFLPKLFKAFSQEDGSLTRQSEGLGLGLMVAKGIARKLGGDLICTRAETDGPHHGSEFEIKVPTRAGETVTRPSSPFGSPQPQRSKLNHVDTPQAKAMSPTLPTTLKGSRTSPDETKNEPTGCQCSLPSPPTPLSPRSPVELAPSDHPRSDTSAPSYHSASKPTHLRSASCKPVSTSKFDRDLANKYPLNILVAEDNKINRKLLVSMLSKFGYKTVVEAHDGAEAVRQMGIPRQPEEQIDVVLMDLWMPLMDGYEAAERILGMDVGQPTVLAVTADVTDGALERAAQVGMKGFMSKPYKMQDLQRLITEYCAFRAPPPGPPEPLPICV